jgi:hypothetical protein
MVHGHIAAVLSGLDIPEPHPLQPLVGLQKVIDWAISFLLNLPASLAFILLSWPFWTVAEKLEVKEFKKQQEANRQDRVDRLRS